MTKAEYAEYVERVEFYLAGMESVSTGPCSGCAECGVPEDAEEHGEEPSFSWAPCEICNRPEGGNRSAWHGVLDGAIVHGSCCTDCAYYLEYGCLDDTTMMQVESEA